MRTRKITVECAICGHPFTLPSRQIGKQFFCRLECALRAEEEGLTFKAGKCLNCGLPMITSAEKHICKRCRKNGLHHIRINHQAAVTGGLHAM